MYLLHDLDVKFVVLQLKDISNHIASAPSRPDLM